MGAGCALVITAAVNSSPDVSSVFVGSAGASFEVLVSDTSSCWVSWVAADSTLKPLLVDDDVLLNAAGGAAEEVPPPPPPPLQDTKETMHKTVKTMPKSLLSIISTPRVTECAQL
jgi:hypothetical protein